jgi:hypothetical protein
MHAGGYDTRMAVSIYQWTMRARLPGVVGPACNGPESYRIRPATQGIL